MFYTMLLIVSLVVNFLIADAGCPNSCSGHGYCTKDNRCVCYQINPSLGTYWTGGDCSMKSCPKGKAWSDVATAVDTAHAAGTVCSNRGLCTDGQCVCQAGWEGVACERLSCPAGCSGHGRCLTMREYAETERNPVHCRTTDELLPHAKCVAETIANRPLLPEDILLPKACATQCENTYTESALPGFASASFYTPYTYSNWDADMIQGCKCDEGWHGYDCTLRTCPKGDDPMTSITVATDTYTTQEIKVTQASTGSFYLGFMGSQTSAITSTDTTNTMTSKLLALPTIDGVTVSFSSGASPISSSGDITFTVTFTQQFGRLPRLTFKSPTLTLTYMKTNLGEKENLECSNRGMCATDTGVCTCATFFKSSNGHGIAGRRGDCGFPEGTITKCPAMNMGTSCSGQNGFCSGPAAYQCSCNQPNTASSDCFLFECPKGPAWFDLPIANNVAHQPAECSNRGICDRTTGICTCQEGFEGTSCERLKCPENGLACSGKGLCASMANLAEFGTDPVTGATASYTYGLTPGDALRWDHASIKGCHCSPGYEGYDCSQQKCPLGDDPYSHYFTELSTAKQKNHIAKITCAAGATGSLVISYKDQSSTAVLNTHSAAEVETAIETMTGVGDVLVSFSTGTTLCGSSENIAYVEYLTLHNGNINYKDQTTRQNPVGIYNLTFSGTLATSVSYGVHVSGTKEYNTCSDRGICDSATGVCTCFSGQGSSDGQTNLGTLANCGHVLAFQTASGR